MRLDNYLLTQYPTSTRSQIAQAIKRGDFTVNGARVKAGYALRPTDVVAGNFQPVKMTATAENIALDVVFEDDYLLVVNKPRGMVVHPGAGVHQGTLLNALLGRTPTAGQLERAGIVHRLDKNTAGLLLVAKTPAVQAQLAAMFARHAVQRTYLGIVVGKIATDLTIDKNIIRDPRQRTRFTTTLTGGRRAVTHLKVLANGAQHTLCQFNLETGRTHQIRVHCLALGHPLLGDPEYYHGQGQMLEAVQLAFVHPVTAQMLKITVAPTTAFQQAAQQYCHVDSEQLLTAAGLKS